MYSWDYILYNPATHILFPGYWILTNECLHISNITSLLSSSMYCFHIDYWFILKPFSSRQSFKEKKKEKSSLWGVIRVHGICTLDQLEGWTMYFGQWGLWLACWILHDLIFVLIKFEECSGDVDDNNYQMWEVCSTLTPDHSTSDALYLLLGQTYTTRDPYQVTTIAILHF